MRNAKEIVAGREYKICWERAVGVVALLET